MLELCFTFPYRIFAANRNVFFDLESSEECCCKVTGWSSHRFYSSPCSSHQCLIMFLPLGDSENIDGYLCPPLNIDQNI